MVKSRSHRARSNVRVPVKKAVGRKRKYGAGRERKFGKRKYNYYNPYINKNDAEQAVKGLRNKGFNARMVKGKDCWRVYEIYKKRKDKKQLKGVI